MSPEPKEQELLDPQAQALLQQEYEAAAEEHGDAGEHENLSPEIPLELNILPLRESVIYPMLIAPLAISRESGVQLIDSSVTGSSRIIGTVTQKDPGTDPPGPDDLYSVGCAVIIRTLAKMPDATRLIVQGVARFKIVEYLQTEPFLKARIEVLPEPKEETERSEEIEALRRTTEAVFDQAVRLSPYLPEELRELPNSVQDTGTMADLIAAHMSLPVEVKQQVLEVQPVIPRLRLLLEALSREVRVLELSSKVSTEVNQELSKSQRDYYLREQIKAIQRELGDDVDSGDGLEDLERKVNDSGMHAEARKEALRELDRLKRINPGSPEYSVARTYVDTMIALPWNKATEDKLDLRECREILDAEHYGLEKIKERILEFLAVRIVRGDKPTRQPILCLSGPPGVGKTSLGRSIATAMHRKFVRMSLGGVRDEAEIRGHRRTYIGAIPGQIIQNLRRCESNNPVFVLDEIDKVTSDWRGDPSSALLEVLDPEQNSTFRDNYIDVPFDLSKVFFIATANRLDTIPAPLRDRMEIIEIGGYTEEEKLQIAIRYLIPKQVEENGLRRSQITFADNAIRKMIHFYTREAGVRNLEREIAAVLRKAVTMFANGRRSKVVVSERFVEEALGVPKYIHEEAAERESVIGMSIGLAWTPVGGEILFIESAIMPGSGLTVTGQLGDVMRESVTAALSYIRSHESELRINPALIEKSEIHVHVPAGAVPKDGPSAGIAMLTALTSLLTEKLVKPRMAMTGELTLTGQVLGVGGIKEKVLAAHRAGVTELLLPKENEKDYYEDVPSEVRKALKVVFVSRAEEVLKRALGINLGKTSRPVKKKSANGK